MTDDFVLKRFIPEEATLAEFSARNVLSNAVRKEAYPEDPPYSDDFAKRNALGWAEMKATDMHVYNLWRSSEVAAELFAWVEHHDENQHLMDARIMVLPAYRRRGLATRLLKTLLEIAESNNRSLITGPTRSKAPAGETFAEVLGARRGLKEDVNLLRLEDVDRSLLAVWQEVPDNVHTEFALDIKEGPYPEVTLTEVAELTQVMNTAPRGELEVEDFTVTSEELRQWEAYHAAQGLTRWTVFVRHKLSGELAGFTELFYDPENPTKMTQEATGVLPKYRGHRLGKWIKAAMLSKVLAERPEVRTILTGNASSNAAMLGINHKLGFKLYQTVTVWQLETDTLKRYLSGKDANE